MLEFQMCVISLISATSSHAGRRHCSCAEDDKSAKIRDAKSNRMIALCSKCLKLSLYCHLVEANCMNRDFEPEPIVVFFFTFLGGFQWWILLRAIWTVAQGNY